MAEPTPEELEATRIAHDRIAVVSESDAAHDFFQEAASMDVCPVCAIIAQALADAREAAVKAELASRLRYQVELECLWARVSLYFDKHGGITDYDCADCSTVGKPGFQCLRHAAHSRGSALPPDQDTERQLLNEQYEPPEGIDPASLRWAADLAWARADEIGDASKSTELRGHVHVLRGFARSRENRDRCCFWCRRFELSDHCSKRAEGPCIATKVVRDQDTEQGGGS